MEKIILLSILLSTSVFAGPAPTKTTIVPVAKSVPTVVTTQLKGVGSIQFKGPNGETEFSAVGKPAMIKINGKGQGPNGILTYVGDKVSGIITVDLTKLTTEIDMRDEHMKNKYLEVQKFPTAELNFKDFKTPGPVESLTENEIEMPFTADFTMHGKTKPISGTAHVKKVGKIISGDAEFSVKIMEYLETLPSYAGIKIAEDVKVKIKFSSSLQ